MKFSEAVKSISYFKAHASEVVKDIVFLFRQFVSYR